MSGNDENGELNSQILQLQLMEKRTQELLLQRKLERECLELECAKMERQKKYMEALLSANLEAIEEQKVKDASEDKGPFAGSGNVLAAPSQPSSSSAVKVVKPDPISVDQSKPTGNIQVRLGDGGKLVVTLNHSHTIRDLKQEIKAKQPSEDARDFNLISTGSPANIFTDLNKTVSELGILSSTVLQRFF